MKITIQLFDEDSEITGVDFELIERIQMDHFVTIWKELDMYDSDYYDSMKHQKSYLKVMKILDKSDKLLYSGVVLDLHELQSKLKHLTRVDVSTKNYLEKLKEIL